MSITDPTSNPTNYVTFNKASGSSLPSTVGKWNDSALAWKVTKVEDTDISPVVVATTYHDVYTILATPSSFEIYNGESGVAWTNMLNLACDWASGQSTASGCIDALTSGLYGYQGLHYNSTSANFDFGYNQLRLKTLLQAIDANDDPNNTPGADCTTYANFLCLLAYSIGMSSASYDGVGYIVIERDGSGERISVNQVYPAYDGLFSTPQSSYSWSYHQIVNFYNPVQLNNYIADAAAKFYNNGNSVLSKGNVSYNNYLTLLSTDTDIFNTPTNGREKPYVMPGY
jgi:hypothetical protein